MRTPEEQTLLDNFEAQYQRLRDPTLQTIEQKVCGCDYGGTSWTTRDEADHISQLLDLAPGRRLLEIGAGSGWPSLYMAQNTGCDLVLVDLPFGALKTAAQRAAKDKLVGDCWGAVADAGALPFPDRQFDAISHSDVLCCLKNKLQVLKNSRRLIRDGGIMVFTVISITPGLSTSDHRHAIEFGPPFVDSESDYVAMLSESYWRITELTDRTDQYSQTSQKYLEELEAHPTELRSLLGTEEYNNNLNRMRTKVEAIKTGFFRRELYVTAPA